MTTCSICGNAAHGEGVQYTRSGTYHAACAVREMEKLREENTELKKTMKWLGKGYDD